MSSFYDFRYRVKLSIIDAVKENGGRFLQPVAGSNEQEWYEADLQVVLDKIAQVSSFFHGTGIPPPYSNQVLYATQSLRYHNRKGKSDEDQPTPKPVPLVVQAHQPAVVASQVSFASVAPHVSLDPAAGWPMVNHVNTNQQFIPPLFANPGLRAAVLGNSFFHSPSFFDTLQKANEERLQEDAWRNFSFLQGAQESADRNLNAYREEL